MSILIKDMEMPITCVECDFCGWIDVYDSHCYCKQYCGEKIDIEVNNGTPEWCPLIELPPHGDLIDRNALYRAFGQPPMPSMGISDDDDDFESGQFYQWKWDMKTIMEQPVIVLAEGSEE